MRSGYVIPERRPARVYRRLVSLISNANRRGRIRAHVNRRPMAARAAPHQTKSRPIISRDSLRSGKGELRDSARNNADTIRRAAPSRDSFIIRGHSQTVTLRVAPVEMSGRIPRVLVPSGARRERGR